MAIVTHTIVSFANGLCRAEIDIDDKNLRVRRGRVINDSDRPAGIEVYKADSLAFSQDVAPHETIERNLPASIRFSMDVGDPVWGYPPAMTMADIRIHVRWG